MITRLNLFLIASILLQGCNISAMMRNVDAREVRNEKNLYKQLKIEKDLKDISSSLYKYSKQCENLTPLTINPGNPKEGLIQGTWPGITDISVIFIMDFTENEGTTYIKTYRYIPTAENFIDTIISAIENPEKCN